jgi:hypothetical protein
VIESGLPKLLVDIAQVVGAIGSIIALALAGFAIYTAKRDLVEERRIQHELDVLRELGKR